jgi:hypothetical protein
MRIRISFLSPGILCTSEPSGHHEVQSSSAERLAWYHAGLKVRHNAFASHHRSSSFQRFPRVHMSGPPRSRSKLPPHWNRTLHAYRICSALSHLDHSISTSLAICGSRGSLPEPNQVVDVGICDISGPETTQHNFIFLHRCDSTRWLHGGLLDSSDADISNCPFKLTDRATCSCVPHNLLAIPQYSVGSRYVLSNPSGT